MLNGTGIYKKKIGSLALAPKKLDDGNTISSSSQHYIMLRLVVDGAFAMAEFKEKGLQAIQSVGGAVCALLYTSS